MYEYLKEQVFLGYIDVVPKELSFSEENNSNAVNISSCLSDKIASLCSVNNFS